MIVHWTANKDLVTFLRGEIIHVARQLASSTQVTFNFKQFFQAVELGWPRRDGACVTCMYTGKEGIRGLVDPKNFLIRATKYLDTTAYLHLFIYLV